MNFAGPSLATIFATTALAILASLAITIIIECSIILLFKPRKRLFVVVLLINIITNPVMNLFILMFWINSSSSLSFTESSMPVFLFLLTVVQASVIFVEAIVIKHVVDFTWRKSVLISLLINGASFFASILVFLFLQTL